MSKTPETDALTSTNTAHTLMQRVEAILNLARKLEIERDEAREKLRKLEVENDHNWQANEMAEQAFCERDEAREQLKWKQHRVEALQRVGSKLLEQRDRLAEALKDACAYPLTGSWYGKAESALAAVKGDKP